MAEKGPLRADLTAPDFISVQKYDIKTNISRTKHVSFALRFYFRIDLFENTKQQRSLK